MVMLREFGIESLACFVWWHAEVGSGAQLRGFLLCVAREGGLHQGGQPAVGDYSEGGPEVVKITKCSCRSTRHVS